MSFSTRRVRHDTRFRRATVKSAENLTPRMVRIVLHSDDFEGFTSLGFDDHVRLFFPQPGTILPIPQPGERGLIWPDPQPSNRDYTPRRFNADLLELTIDFVIHETGIASDWAASAKPGDVIGVGGPRGSFILEGAPDWQLLMGDETALPAIGRRVEELAAGTKATAVIEVEDEREEQHFETRADLQTIWLHRNKSQSLSTYLEQVELPGGEGFVFFAAEAGTVAAARERFARLGLPSDSLKAANYWRKGTPDADEH